MITYGGTSVFDNIEQSKECFSFVLKSNKALDNGKYHSPQQCLMIQAINQDQVVMALATYMQNGNQIIYDKITTHFLNKTEQSLGENFALYNAFLIRKGL